MDPVKCIPAMYSWEVTILPARLPRVGRKLITPWGSPASLRTSIMYQLESTAVVAGFHTAVFPMRAGAVGRLAAMEVKLKGVTANTNPSRGLYSMWLIWPWSEDGCHEKILEAKAAFIRRKSMVSAAESISA